MSLAERVRLAEDAAHLEDVALDMILVRRGGSLSVFIAGDDLAEGEKILRRLGATEVRSTTVFGPYVVGMVEALEHGPGGLCPHLSEMLLPARCAVLKPGAPFAPECSAYEQRPLPVAPGQESLL